MEALEPGRPLSFLDHRIVLGNALLGATPELIAAGVPPDAFKPILGDDKKLVIALRTRNDQELAGQTLFDIAAATVDADARALAEQSSGISAVDDRSLAGTREQQRRFEQLLASPELRRAALAADVWCTAFVADKHPGATVITQDVLARALASGTDGLSHEELAAVAARRERYRFLHWHVAFPAVWERGGFEVVLGNPPWEHTELKEKEFFATRAPDIAAAATGAARKRMIAQLADDDPSLFAGFQAAKRQADGFSHFVRSSGRYPLCGRGRINTYAIFAELMRNLVGPAGRLGCIVPTGIATDDTTKHFFQAIVDRHALVSLFGFENEERLFAGLHHERKFCLLTLLGTALRSEVTEFVFFARRLEHLNDDYRRFTLSPDEIALLNPNTRTCPVFRSRRDADLNKAIYHRVPVLVDDDDPNGDPWCLTFKQGLFNMTSDSNLFHTHDQLEADGFELNGNEFERGDERWLPLYEAKMLHQYDHRWATYENGETRDLTESEKANPSCLVLPRYWVAAGEVQEQLTGWSQDWLLGWRDITNPTNERTVIFAVLPPAAVGHTSPLALVDLHARSRSALMATLNSFILDYIARQKLGGTHLTYGLLMQFAIPTPDMLAGALDLITPRVLELTYTAVDLAAFARDLLYDGEPFGWDPGRRALIRAELDAAMFRLYGMEREDVGYVMETFPVIKRRDEQQFGEYRTKRLILERYDGMAAAEAAGQEYETPLDPPPGDPAAAHRSPAPAASI